MVAAVPWCFQIHGEGVGAVWIYGERARGLNRAVLIRDRETPAA